MMNSNERRELEEKHERNRDARLESIKRWAAYIEAEPPEVWGPQLNSLVDSQLEAARESGVTADQYRRVERAGREYRHDRDAP